MIERRASTPHKDRRVPAANLRILYPRLPTIDRVLTEESSMTVLIVLAGVAGAGLFVYLVYALLRAEDF